ncbi:MAG: DUF5719 family protein [Actinomycetota bacterium]
MAFLLVVIAAMGAVMFAGDKVPSKKVDERPVGAIDFLSTGWYCPSPDVGGLDAHIATTNVGDERVHLRVRAIGSGRSSTPAESDLAAEKRSTVRLKDLGVPQSVGLTEAFGSAATNDLTVLGDGGLATSRCSTQPWDRWYFANASTSRGTNTYLLIANPFQEEAVVNIRLLMPTGESSPARLKDILIPRSSQASILLAEFVPESPTFGVEVVATQGRVVTSRFVQAASRDGTKGISLDVGQRLASAKWFFAGGHVPADGEETVQLANPTDSEALVQVIFVTDTDQISPQQLQEIQVPAGSQSSIKVSDLLPRGTKHSTIVSVTNDSKVISEVTTVEAVGPGKGIEIATGVPDGGQKWELAVGSPAGGTQTIDLLNTTTSPLVAKIAIIGANGLSRPAELSDVKVAGGRRVSIDLTPYLAGGSGAVLVETNLGSIAVAGHLVLGPPYADFADQVAQSF